MYFSYKKSELTIKSLRCTSSITKQTGVKDSLCLVRPVGKTCRTQETLWLLPTWSNVSLPLVEFPLHMFNRLFMFSDESSLSH